jgi:phage shock protein A
MQDAREEHAKLTAEVSSLRRLRRQLAEEIMNTVAAHKRLVEQALAEGDAGS